MKVLKLKKHNFFANLITVGQGSIIAHLIQISSSALLSRIYDPSQLGRFFVLISLTTVFAILCTLRFDLAINYTRSNFQTLNLTLMSVISTGILSALIFGMICIYHVIFQIENRLFFYIPATILALGFYNTFLAISIRYSNYTYYSLYRVVVVIVTCTIQIVAGYIYKDEKWLVYGYLIGYLSVSILFILTHINVLRLYRFFIGLGQMKKFIIRYKHFTIDMSLVGLLSSLNQAVPLWVINIFYGNSMAGYFGFAYRTVVTPTNLVSDSVKQVYIRKMVNTEDCAHRYSITIKIMVYMSLILLVPSFILIQFGEKIFSVFLGEHWRYSGALAAALLPLLWSKMLFNNFGPLCLSLNKNRFLLYFILSLTCVSILVLISSSFFLTIEKTLLLFGSAVFILYCSFFYYLRWKLHP